MCCLKYEQEAYEDIAKRMPQEGSLVDTPAGRGTVAKTCFLKEKVYVKIEQKDGEPEMKLFELENIDVIKRVRKKTVKSENQDVNINELKSLED